MQLNINECNAIHENNNIQPKFYILTNNEAKNFIINDEDNFINNLTIFDLRARKMLSSQDYKNKVLSSFNYTPTKDVYNKLLKLTKIADDIMINYYPELYSINWNFAIFTDKIYEGGFPHTRFDIIFLPLDLLLYADDKSLIKTLIHEKIHLLQRLYPDNKLLKTFLNENNFNKYMLLTDMRKSYPKIRSNPDLDNYVYSNNNKFFICEYTKDYPTNLMDVIQDSSTEHPFEIMAYQISEDLIKYL
jgi:hypothetical protein